jgi:hypothetical protein
MRLYLRVISASLHSKNKKGEQDIMPHFHRILLLSVFMILAGGTSLAQTFRGAISGNVTDTTGAAIAGAKVQLVNDSTGLSRNQETTSSGDFSFSELPVGFYTLTITKEGFEVHKLRGRNVCTAQRPSN